MESIVAASNAVIGNEIKVITDIHSAAKNIAVYQRQIDHLKAELATLSNQDISFKASGEIAQIQDALANYFDNSLPSCPLLIQDISFLLEAYQQLTKASSFRVSFITVNSDMCKRFHTDINKLRMLCTYVGPGTLWLPTEIVNTAALVKKQGNEEIVTDPSQIQQAKTGDVLILKGAMYPNADAILHRSPSIEETNAKRLLLRVDTNDFTNIFS